MKFQEPDLRGLSLEELKIRNGLESSAARERAASVSKGAARTSPAESKEPVLSR